MSPFSITAQTGWKRPSPQAICQDVEVLCRVKTFTYEESWPGFMDYAKGRLGSQISPASLQDCWELFLPTPDEIRIHTVNGARYRKGWLVLDGVWFVQIEPSGSLKLTHTKSGQTVGYLEHSPEAMVARLKLEHGDRFDAVMAQWS